MSPTLSNARVLCVLGLAASLLDACGSSRQALPSPVLPPAGGGGTLATSSPVTIVIKLPYRKAQPSASRRRPQYVSPSIASVKVSVTATGSPATSVTSNVVCNNATPPACTVSATILAPVQKSDTFGVTTYDGPNATGNVLSQGSTVYAVPAGQAVRIPIVLEGTVAAVVAVTVANRNLPTGSAGSTTASITATDADGNVIAGSYQTPITLQLFENDSEGLFSFAQSGPILATTTVASSTVPATVYLKAKMDLTTPDDATVVATLAHAPFVPGTSSSPPLASLGEISTTCPTSSPVCVFYPSGYDILATTIPQSGTTGSINHWDAPSVIPGTAQDPGGATSIWNVSSLEIINRFDTANRTFVNVSNTSPQADLTKDLAGSFWAVTSQNGVDAVHFSTNGATLDTYDLSNVTYTFANETIASSFDSAGQLWGIDGGLFALNVTSRRVVSCAFEITDTNFASPYLTTLEAAGANIWLGVSGAADGNTYVFKVPAQSAASGCDLTKLETPASEFKLAPQAGQLDATHIAVDTAGDAYVLQYTAVTKITPAGRLTKLVDTGVTFAQGFGAGFALDPAGTTLYLVDTQTGLLDRASTTAASSNPLPSLVLPPVFGIATFAFQNGASAYYQPFFTTDGTLWIGDAPFYNSAVPFSLLGTGNAGYQGGLAVFGGLARIDLASATFTNRTVAPAHDRGQIIRMLRSHRAAQRSRGRS